MFTVVRHNLVADTRKVVYETPDRDDAELYVERNFPHAHVESGQPVEEYTVEENDA